MLIANPLGALRFALGSNKIYTNHGFAHLTNKLLQSFGAEVVHRGHASISC